MTHDAKPLPQPWEITQRVAAIRKQKGMTQRALAEAIGLSRPLLANIEKGRRNLRFPIGWNICKVLNVNQWFLATGQLPDHPFIDFDPMDTAGRIISESSDFAAVCINRFEHELRSGNEYLTNVSLSAKHQSVKAQLPKLLERLNRATSERGKKTELAKFLGVPLVSVSQWLSGVKEPGGEKTLQLLRWVEQQERK